MKLLPLMTKVNAEDPAAVDEGVRTVRTGTGLGAVLMVKVRALEVPPPGDGLKTVTLAVPAVAISVAGMDAVSWVEDIYVVPRSALFHRTTEPGTKLLPVRVKVKAALPAVAEEGEMLVSTGTGFGSWVPASANPFTQTL
jgi:hypothetical protein